MPLITVAGVENGTLVLEHEYDGRELEINYAKETIKYVAVLWGARVELKTMLYAMPRVIRCEQGVVTMGNDEKTGGSN